VNDINCVEELRLVCEAWNFLVRYMNLPVIRYPSNEKICHLEVDKKLPEKGY